MSVKSQRRREPNPEWDKVWIWRNHKAKEKKPSKRDVLTEMPSGNTIKDLDQRFPRLETCQDEILVFGFLLNHNFTQEA